MDVIPLWMREIADKTLMALGGRPGRRNAQIFLECNRHLFQERHVLEITQGSQIPLIDVGISLNLIGFLR